MNKIKKFVSEHKVEIGLGVLVVVTGVVVYKTTAKAYSVKPNSNATIDFLELDNGSKLALVTLELNNGKFYDHELYLGDEDIKAMAKDLAVMAKSIKAVEAA